MPRRPQHWEIVEKDHDIFDVTRGHRPMATGLASRKSAESIVRQHRQPGERVHLVESDNYRTELTKHFPDPKTASDDSPAPISNPDRPVWGRYLARYGRLR